jgi:hypothetical protein
MRLKIQTDLNTEKMDIQDPSCSNQALTMSKHFVLQANEENTAKAKSFPSGNLKMRYRQSEMAHVWVTFTIIKAIDTFCNSFILITSLKIKMQKPTIARKKVKFEEAALSLLLLCWLSCKLA